MITLRDSLDGIEPRNLHGFFVGWPNPPSPETHLRLLAGSDVAVIAVDDTSGNVAGFITALTDGVLTAFIPLLEVLPEYQHQGIGSRLVERAVERLSALYSIDLLCDTDVQPFYKSLGFREASGMAIRNYPNQAGNATAA